MEKLLTVIIPTHNMQDYLCRCLDSLVVRPDLMDILEVLVINDGSNDDSSVIAHGYQERFPGVIRVIDKENGHYGSCVNRGLAEATGKYIKLLDADDWFDTPELEKLLEKLPSIDVDLILTSYKIVDNKGKTIGVVKQKVNSGEVFEINSNPTPNVTSYAMYMVTWRTELLRRINYVQTEGINYTDTEWRCIPLYEVGKCVYYPFCIYHYLLGRIGQSSEDVVMNRNVWQFETCVMSLIHNRARYNVNDYPLANRENEYAILMYALNIYKIILIRKKATEEDLSHLKKFDDYLHESCPEVWKKAGEHTAKKWLPIKYIEYWRKTGRVFSLNWMRRKRQ